MKPLLVVLLTGGLTALATFLGATGSAPSPLRAGLEEHQAVALLEVPTREQITVTCYTYYDRCLKSRRPQSECSALTELCLFP